MENSNILTYIVAGFLIVNLIIGLWAGRGVKDFRDFAIGNKRWSVGALVMTFIATNLEGGSLLRGLKSYAIKGVSGFASTFGLVLGCILMYFFLAPKMYRFKGCITMGDVSEKLFGKYVKVYTGIFASLESIIFYGIQLEIISSIFEKFLNIDGSLALYSSAIIIILYTATGGMRSVVGTDIFQFIFIGVMMFVLSSVSISQAGGTKQLLQNLSPEKYVFFKGNLLPSMISICILNSLFCVDLLGAGSFPRVLMANGKMQLQKLFIYSAICYIIYSISRFFIGSAISSIAPEASNDIIGYIFNNLLSTSTQSILLLGILSLSLSSADSFLQGASIAITNDCISTVFGKKYYNLKFVRILVILLGMLGIIFAKSNLVYVDLSFIYAVIAPTLAFPFLISIIGLKPSKRGFWIAAIVGFSIFLILNYGIFGDLWQELATLVGSLMNAFIYLTIHFIENKKFEIADDLKKLNHRKIFKTNYTKKIFTSIINLLTKFPSEARKLVMGQPDYYTIFGVFNCIVTFIPYLLLNSNVFVNDQIIYLKVISIACCCLLMTHSFWPNNIQKYIPAFWYITLTYCLPFMSVAMLFISQGAIEYTINVAINIMFLILLVDWASAIVIAIIGTLSAICYYKFFIQIDPSEIIFEFNTKYLLIYQIIFGSIIGLLFARRRELEFKNLSFNAFFLNLFKKNTLFRSQKTIGILHDTTASYKDFLIDPLHKIGKLKKFLDEKNFDQAKKEIAILEEFIQANKKQLTPYCTLDVEKIELSQLLLQIEKISKSLGVKNILIQNYSNEEKISCDKVGLLKIIWKFITDYKLLKIQNQDDDYYICCDLRDVIVNYISDDEKKIVRSLNGISITIAEDGFLQENNFKKTYQVHLQDPESIPPVGKYDEELIDIENLIHAHYGIMINMSQNSDYAYQFVIPVALGEIRPAPLDLRAPIDVYYNWPDAAILEKIFLEKIKNNFASCDEKKIMLALKIIKEYHFHQTRKSGEPYYLHPINVADIAIEIALDKNSKIYKVLNDNIEVIILSALMHDILEDTAMHLVALNNIFGLTVTDIVKEVTKIDYNQRAKVLSNKDAFTKLIDQNPIVVCIKLADRLHNLMTIDGHPKVEKRKAVAQETLDFFVHPAQKYGLKSLEKKLLQVSHYIIKNGTINGFKFEQ